MNKKVLALVMAAGMFGVPLAYAGECANTTPVSTQTATQETTSDGQDSSANPVSAEPNSDYSVAPQNWVEYGAGG